MRVPPLVWIFPGTGVLLSLRVTGARDNLCMVNMIVNVRTTTTIIAGMVFGRVEISVLW